MTVRPALRLGTRGSKLALIQAEAAAAALRAAHGDLAAPGAIEIVVIRTTGDRVTDRRLAELGGKGLFAKEIEAALAAGEIDLGVHSMKDVETHLADGMAIGAMMAREDPRDVLIARHGATAIADLPPGAVVGTASLRREAQLRARRPDLAIALLRGNVPTRLDKVACGEVDATLLAYAGLRRLGLGAAGGTVLDVDEILPAVGQGAVGIEHRADDARVATLVAALDDEATALCVGAERAMLDVLDGTCNTPIGGLATLDGGTMTLRGLIAKADGSQIFRAERTGPRGDSDGLGRAIAEELLSRAGRDFLAAMG